jgi:hypothetical protein
MTARVWIGDSQPAPDDVDDFGAIFGRTHLAAIA